MEGYNDKKSRSHLTQIRQRQQLTSRFKKGSKKNIIPSFVNNHLLKMKVVKIDLD